MKKLGYLILMTLFLIFFVNALLAQTAIEPSGSGDIGDPFLINSLENLYWLTSNQSVWGTGYYFSQTADILAFDTMNWFNGSGWIPIGNESNPFSGTYLGNGHAIRNLYLDRPSESNCGLFGVSTGQILDLGVTIGLMYGWENVGAVVGYSYGSIGKCYSSPADNFVGIFGQSNVGGVAGCVEYDTEGWLGNGFTYDCFSTCAVSGWSRIGGITGHLIRGTLRNSYYSGQINPSGTDVSQCGALVGVSNDSQIEYCYWNIDTADIDHSAGGEPRNANQMTTLYPLDTYMNWDFNNVWAFDTEGTQNGGLPFLGNPTPPLVSSVPSPVALISPLDNSQLIGLNSVYLRWQYSLSPGWTDYMRGARFYVGTDNPPTNLINGWDAGMVNGVSPYVQPDTTYYWQIVPYNELGSAINCPVWSFTTHSISMQILTPNGGEVWMSGTTQKVEWTSNASIPLALLFSYDGGNNWYDYSTVDGTTPYCYVQVPVVNSINCLFKIDGYQYNSLFDVSDASFKISTSSALPKVVVSFPSSSGLTFTAGQTIDISWIRQQTASVDLYFSTDDGVSWEPIVQNLNNDCYSWVIPNLNSSSCRIKVAMASNPAVLDVSDNCFDIVGIGNIQLLSPVGGECITSDYSSTSVYPIRWTSSNVTSVKLEYSSNNGYSWTTITTGIGASSGTYSWTVPSIISNQYLIRISDTLNPQINDDSTNPFSVQVPVVILNANGGGFITNNSLFTIRWRNIDVPSGSFIQWMYSRTNGASPWFNISSYEGVPSDQGYLDWFVNTGELSTLVIAGRLVGTDRIIARSASSITVTNSYLQIIEPNGGECYTPGSSQTIRWDGWGVSSLNVFLSTDGGTTWQVIGINISASSANYQWVVPNSPSSSCRIKLSDVNVNYMNLFSENAFTISSSSIPSQVLGVNLAIDQSDVVISWDAVTTDNEGNSLQPDAYIVRYSLVPDAVDWITLSTTTDLQAIHVGAANQYGRIFYRVTAIFDSVIAP